MEIAELGGVGSFEMPPMEPLAQEASVEVPAPELPPGYDGQDAFEAASEPPPLDLSGGAEPSFELAYQPEATEAPEGPIDGAELNTLASESTDAEAAASEQTEAEASAQSGSYVVQPGDTLSAIAAAHGTTVEAISAANGISDPNLIMAGQNLVIPGASSGAAPVRAPVPTQTGPGNPGVAAAAQQVANQGTAATAGWDYWCLLFVQDMVEQGTGSRDGNLWGGATGNAVGAMRNLQSAGLLNPDMNNVPLGASIFWAGGADGHVAIAAGRDAQGNQLVTTTGWQGYSGVRTTTLEEVNARLGRSPGGWYLSPSR